MQLNSPEASVYGYDVRPFPRRRLGVRPQQKGIVGVVPPLPLSGLLPVHRGAATRALRVHLLHAVQGRWSTPAATGASRRHTATTRSSAVPMT